MALSSLTPTGSAWPALRQGGDWDRGDFGPVRGFARRREPIRNSQVARAWIRPPRLGLLTRPLRRAPVGVLRVVRLTGVRNAADEVKEDGRVEQLAAAASPGRCLDHNRVAGPMPWTWRRQAFGRVETAGSRSSQQRTRRT